MKFRTTPVPVDAPRRELFVRSFGFVVHSPLDLAAKYFFVRRHRMSIPAAVLGLKSLNGFLLSRAKKYKNRIKT